MNAEPPFNIHDLIFLALNQTQLKYNQYRCAQAMNCLIVKDAKSSLEAAASFA